MRRHRAFYRTSDGAADYDFSFEERSDGTWRIYIECQPSYRGRNESAEATHRLRDGSRRYVCWTDPIRSLSAAKQLAKAWADNTQKYIRTGQTF